MNSIALSLQGHPYGKTTHFAVWFSKERFAFHCHSGDALKELTKANSYLSSPPALFDWEVIGGRGSQRKMRGTAADVFFQLVSEDSGETPQKLRTSTL